MSSTSKHLFAGMHIDGLSSLCLVMFIGPVVLYLTRTYLGIVSNLSISFGTILQF
jgi:hypothetical protein